MKNKNHTTTVKNISMAIRRALLWPLKKIAHFGVKLTIKLIKKTNILSFTKRVSNRYKNLTERHSYNTWANENEDQCYVRKQLDSNPLISIVVPAYNTDSLHFREMIYSVINQHYENWELIIVNASDNTELRKSINSCVEIDTRIKLVKLKKNYYISRNTNAGIRHAKGEFMAFLDHDDLLHPCALHCVVEEIESTNADLVYSDEHKVTENGDFYFDPHCKPDWSPNLLENVNYINHLTVVRTEYVKGVGLLRQEFDGAQDYDLLLRIIDKYSPVIGHIQRVLYSWRAASTSTASDIGTKSYVMEAGQKALQEHLHRKKIKAKAVVIKNKPGFYEIQYDTPESITILIGEVDEQYRHNCAGWLKKFFKKYGSANIQLVVGKWAKDYGIDELFENVHLVSQETSYLRQAVMVTQNDHIIFFQEAAMPRSREDLFKLAGAVEQLDCFALQPVLAGQGKYIVDTGMVDVSSGLQPLFKNRIVGDNTFFGNTDWVRDIDRISGRVTVIKKQNLIKLVEERKKNYLWTYDFPEKKSYIVWAHCVFDYKGILTSHYPSKYFNSQLEHASYELRIKNSNWKKEDIIDDKN